MVCKWIHDHKDALIRFFEILNECFDHDLSCHMKHRHDVPDHDKFICNLFHFYDEHLPMHVDQSFYNYWIYFIIFYDAVEPLFLLFKFSPNYDTYLFFRLIIQNFNNVNVPYVQDSKIFVIVVEFDL